MKALVLIVLCPCSRRESSPIDDITALGYDLYFDPHCWRNHTLLDERRLLKTAGSLTSIYSGTDPKLSVIQASATQNGEEAVAKRLLDLVLKDEYTAKGLFHIHLDLFKAFAQVKKITRILVAQHAHVSIIRKTWDVLHVAETSKAVDTGLNPRSSIQLLYP